MNPALRHAAAHVFVESVSTPELVAADRHHLVDVLRLRPGERITVGDGAGGWAPAVLTGSGVELAGEIVADARPLPVTVAAAPPKGDRPEWMVQKLTELGVTRIAFVDCRRGVVRWSGERATRQLARLRRVAREAAMQSRRTWLPEVLVGVPFAHAAAWEGMVQAEPGGTALGPSAAGVLVGPEGGFAPEELECGLPLVSLGDAVLRVETAALAAAVLLRGARPTNG